MSPIRRFFMLASLIFVAQMTHAQPTHSGDAYVIVHGAWGGSWDWKETAAALTANGHKVYRPALTGLGERSHLTASNLLGDNINLSTHIQDVVNVIVWEDLRDVVLVGHSYGGMVITGVADKIADRLKRTIYLDAMVPGNRQSVNDFNMSLGRTNAPTGGLVKPFWLRGTESIPHDVPHPAKTWSEQLVLTNQVSVARIPSTYIFTVDPGADATRDTFYQHSERAKFLGWNVVTMQADHNPQRTQLKELVGVFESSSQATNTPLPRSDANGNPLRRAPTGHISNYDESKVGKYTLPDPLVLANGQPVRDARTWETQRRPEILKLYQTEIYGRVPDRAPKMTWEVTETDSNALDGAATRKRIMGRIGETTNRMNVTLYLPKSSTPAPVLLHFTFTGGGAPTADTNSTRPRFTESGPMTNMLARGYGYALVRYTEFEGDSRSNSVSIVRAAALAPGQTQPASDEWGTISAWAWGASRILDYFETDKDVDAKRVGFIGHSRLGKTALWVGASDPRFAILFPSCSGEMGASLARRDFGETVDDMAANFPWQFAGNVQKYPGRWNDMPVDSHMLIALSAPRPVFITGGTQDQWADPHGEFLGAVAAGPVYRLLGKNDVGRTEMPLDVPLIEGSIGFHYHTGGHVITPSDWTAFLDFADRHLKSP